MAEVKTVPPKVEQNGQAAGDACPPDASIAGGMRDSEMFVNMGPQHPSTHGVLRVLLRLDGERIIEAKGDIGYLHRCFEKIAEKRSIFQVIPYTDRTDYLAAITSEWPLVMAAERLLNVQAPERAEHLRVIMAELQRIASHLIWFGAFSLDVGATTAFLYAWRERERLLDIFEAVTGARMLYNYFRIGGVRNDITPDFEERVVSFLDDMEKRLHEYHQLVTGNRIFETRTRGIGVLTAADAIRWGASGPVLRGSGVDYDIRKAHPYSIYDRFDFSVPVGRDGDCYDRYVVRMEEMRESAKIIRQALAKLPEGEYMGKAPRRMKLTGDTYVRVESPRGEVGCYLVGDGTDQAYRCKWRSPCFTHLMLLEPLGRGAMMADMVVIIGSFDIVMGEVDR